MFSDQGDDYRTILPLPHNDDNKKFLKINVKKEKKGGEAIHMFSFDAYISFWDPT